MNAQRPTKDQNRKPADRGVCPLCERAFLRARLHAHITREPARTRRAVAEAIKEKFPSWSTGAGACRACWESFRDVARVVSFLKRFRFPKSLPAALALALIVAGCGKPAPQTPQKIAVQTARAESMGTRG